MSRVMAQKPCSAVCSVQGRPTARLMVSRRSVVASGAEDDRNLPESKLTDVPDPSEPDMWDSQAAGIAVQVGFATICLAAVAAILSLAEPVIDNTIAAFPYEESGSGYYNP